LIVLFGGRVGTDTQHLQPLHHKNGPSLSLD
jgi:hypothetical protein